MNKIERCLNLELRKANRVLSQIYDSYLANCGLKTSQFSILRAIRELQKTTNRELQDILVIDQTTLSRGLKPLIRDGFITVREGADRRQKELMLSAAGKALFLEASTHWEAAQQHVATALGDATKQQLLSLSKAIVKLKA